MDSDNTIKRPPDKADTDSQDDSVGLRGGLAAVTTTFSGLQDMSGSLGGSGGSGPLSGPAAGVARGLTTSDSPLPPHTTLGINASLGAVDSTHGAGNPNTSPLSGADFAELHGIAASVEAAYNDMAQGIAPSTLILDSVLESCRSRPLQFTHTLKAAVRPEVFELLSGFLEQRAAEHFRCAYSPFNTAVQPCRWG